MSRTTPNACFRKTAYPLAGSSRRCEKFQQRSTKTPNRENDDDLCLANNVKGRNVHG